MTNELPECLCCGHALKRLIDFGEMPLVNTYAITDKFPLAVNRCVSCCHLQLSEFVNPEILYRDYAYQSGTGQTALDFFAEFARIALTYFPTARNVLDIACNDGSQLDAFKYYGLETCGIDPAKNLLNITVDKGHDVLCGFFENTSTDRIFDILTAQNVIAHTPNPLKFLEKCASLMNEQSRLFIMTSQANMVVNGECDTIYHEHVSYFNAHSMDWLCSKADLQIEDVLMHDIHGTSFIFVLSKGRKYKGVPLNGTIGHRIDWEFYVGMTSPGLYRWWTENTRRNIERVRKNITSLRESGYYLVGCGAAAKGISMLNMAGVKLDVIVDSTSTKWHKQTNGMDILPFDRIELITHEKVAFVILPWNLRSEIRKNVTQLRNKPRDVFVDTK